MIFQRSVLHPLINGLTILLLFWLVGLGLFTRDVMEQKPGFSQEIRKADGIVVLTGGTARVPAGLDLLAAGLAPRLMISGVDPRISRDTVVPPGHKARGLLGCCITLGTFAEDTVGNARETAAWAERDKIKSLIVVTSNYHMRRAMLEFAQVLPDAILVPYVVISDKVHLESWWDSPGSASLLMNEYVKYLLALVKAGLHSVFKS